MAGVTEERQRTARRRHKAQLRIWQREAVKLVTGRCKGCGVLYERETLQRDRKRVTYCSKRCAYGTGAYKDRARYERIRIEAAEALRRAGVEIAPPLEAPGYLKLKWAVSLGKELKTLGVTALPGSKEWFAAALRETLGY